jgi:hypothetical protein
VNGLLHPDRPTSTGISAGSHTGAPATLDDG